MFVFIRRLRARMRYRHFDRDLERELETHRAMKEAELRARGVTDGQLPAETNRSMGNMTIMREDSREVWLARWLVRLYQDTRYALTMFRRQPAFSLGVILILGIGLGLISTIAAYADALVPETLACHGPRHAGSRVARGCGLAPDVTVRTLGSTEPTVYLPPQKFSAHLLITSTDPGMASRLQDVASRIDPGVTVVTRSLRESARDSLFAAVIGSRVAWGIGLVGLILATIGAFGVFAQAVEERRREIGIYMALGARGAQVLRVVLTTTRKSVGLGLAGGLLLSTAGTPLLRKYLYGLSPYDPIAYLQIAVILVTAAVVATWIPVRRAARVSPAETLRAD